MASESLYRRILGPRFDALPEVLHRFHDAPGGGRARGTFTVERAPGWLRNGLATLLGLPQAAAEVPVRLEVVLEGDREHWVRHFGDRRVETVQWASAGLLMERFGPVSFSSALVLDGSCLRYQFARAWYLALPLPRWLAPSAEGSADAGSGGWRVSVRISAPILGELVRYEGWVEPE
jgi:hypothetical protein